MASRQTVELSTRGDLPLSYEAQLSATEFRRQFQAIRDSYKRYSEILAEARKVFLDPKRSNEALEAHVRVFFIDRFLSALRWNSIPVADMALPNMVPEAQVDPEIGKRRFLDYFGYERDVARPLLVFEAKKPDERGPVKIGGSSDPSNLAKWLEDGTAPHPWKEWLASLQLYVRTVFARTGGYPKRVAIANGVWLVIFSDPGNAFGGTERVDPEHIYVFLNADQIDERYETVYNLLAQPRVSQAAVEVEPGELPSLIAANKVKSLTHGIRLYYGHSKTVEQDAPVITVMPLVLIRSVNDSWIRCAGKGEKFMLPDKYADLRRHLAEVAASAQQLLQRVNTSLGTSRVPLSLEAHYSDSNSFKAVKGIEEIYKDKNHFILLTGTMTHYLREEPGVTNCPYHDYGQSRERGLAGNLPSVYAKSTLSPRTYFVSKELHHCVHADVHRMKHAPTTEENKDRCGPRSWSVGAAFCEIAPFEEFLCCTTCSFESVCSKSELLQLPCRLVQIS
jgi:hypothetical protein